MNGSCLDSLLSTLGNLKMKILSSRNFSLAGQYLLKSPTEYWLHINNCLIYKKRFYAQIDFGNAGLDS